MTSLNLTDAQATFIIAETYGITVCRLERLGSETASTFRADTDAGSYAAKFQGADAKTALVQQWRSNAMHRLADLGHPVPRLLTDLAGRRIAFTHVGHQLVAIQLMEWVQAQPYGDTRVTASLGEHLGRVAAQVQRDLAEMVPPPSPISHSWDARTMASELKKQMPSTSNAEVSAIGKLALSLHERFVAPVEHELPFALVHQDLHDSNILINDFGEIAAILDFDDMLVGWRVAEPAIAAAYLSRHLSNPAEALETVRAGWTESTPFTAAENQAFTPLAAMRLALNAAIWANRFDGDRGDYAKDRAHGSVAAFHSLASELPNF